MIKYNIVICCYDKILVNVAACVIPVWVYVVCWSGVTFAVTFTKILSQQQITVLYFII